mmetsp:Transcript_6288/g.10579  ORF Transcript_6288/g.10579 Transcript_6288/m.10579 type:complete len:361 (-) Transcript_6288:68-1150(-)
MAKPPSTTFGRFVDKHVNMIIRPPRHEYDLDDLGEPVFNLGCHTYQRIDLELENPRGQKLLCSHIVPHEKPEEKQPCVIYLHGNCSSRFEAFGMMSHLLKRNLSVFCLDLSGSGRSEGDYVSLGWHEEQDLKVAVDYLRAQDRVSSIGFWGRSMGAATAILRAADDHRIGGCVLDSAFGDLSLVAEEVVRTAGYNVPSILLNIGLQIMRSEVKAKADFDMTKLKPLKYAARAACPALFGVAGDDNFVLPHHTWDICEAWGGHRVLHVFEGDHNGRRPSWFLEEAADFLCQSLNASTVALRPSPPLRPPPFPAPRDSSLAAGNDVPEERTMDVPIKEVTVARRQMRTCSRPEERPVCIRGI